VSLKRDASPVPRDVTEQTMFNFVPFARSGWKVADFNNQTRFVRQLLQLQFPQTIAVSVAAAAIGSHQDAIL